MILLFCEHIFESLFLFQIKTEIMSRPRPNKRSQTSKICQICGDKASGVNFNVLTCMSCKAFFRRNALVKNEQNMNCPFDNHCELNKVTRKFCPKCRLRKCFHMGMVKEWILSEEEKQQKKDIRVERQKILEKETMDRLFANEKIHQVKYFVDSTTNHNQPQQTEQSRTSSVICHAINSHNIKSDFLPQNIQPTISTIPTSNGFAHYPAPNFYNSSSRIAEILNRNNKLANELSSIEKSQQQQQQNILYKPSTYIILEPFML